MVTVVKRENHRLFRQTETALPEQPVVVEGDGRKTAAVEPLKLRAELSDREAKRIPVCGMNLFYNRVVHQHPYRLRVSFRLFPLDTHQLSSHRAPSPVGK